MSERQYDLVLFGATGFTGALTAEYIAKNAPTNLKWAIAGRSESKLQNTKGEVEKRGSYRIKVGMYSATFYQGSGLIHVLQKP